MKFILDKNNLPPEWPSPEAKLTPRDGWELGDVRISSIDGRKLIPAMLRGQFAVHGMDRSEGFCFSTVTGYRITSNGRVFATADAAMAVSEICDECWDGWHAWVVGSRRLDPNAQKILNENFDKSQKEGHILRTIVRVA